MPKQRIRPRCGEQVMKNVAMNEQGKKLKRRSLGKRQGDGEV
jgi:hypothetical protein